MWARSSGKTKDRQATIPGTVINDGPAYEKKVKLSNNSASKINGAYLLNFFFFSFQIGCLWVELLLKSGKIQIVRDIAVVSYVVNET